MKSKTITIVAIIIILVLGGAVAWLFTSGKLVWVGPNSRVSVTNAVCNSDTVETYNNAMFYAIRDGSTDLTLDKAGLDTLQADIKKKAGYENDATCQTMLFWMAVNDADYEASKKAYEVVKNLHSRGVFANSNLRTNQPLFTYEATVTSLSPEAQNNSEGVGDDS